MDGGAMRRISGIATLAVLLLPAAAQAMAGELVLVDESAPPYMYDTADGPAGLCPAVLREAFRRAGESVMIQTAPWKRLLILLERGAAGGACLRETADRRAVLAFTRPLYTQHIALYVRRGRAFDYQGVASLRDRRLGVRRGWSYGDDFDGARAAGQFSTEEVSGDAENLARLADGRLDAVLIARASADQAAATSGLAGRILPLETEAFAAPVGLAFAKTARREALIARLDRALETMRSDGTLAAMIDAAGERPETSSAK
jgi:polar amino acid transport system substrate-binding protein